MANHHRQSIMNYILIITVLLQHQCFGNVLKTPPSSESLIKPRNAPLELIILHNNDMHARFEQTGVYSNTCHVDDVKSNKCFGGFARVSTKVKEYRQAADRGGIPVLYLNAGDTYTGTPWFTLYKDKIVTEFMNHLKPDAISLGNHEFDNDIAGLVPFLDNVTFPVLAANIDTTKEPTMAAAKSLRKSTIFNINGVSIGVIGYLTPETKQLSAPNQVEITDEIAAINAEAAQLKSGGVNIIIGLGHSGLQVDQEIAKNCPELDLVIGGHSHTFLHSSANQPSVEVPKGPYPVVVTRADGKSVPVVQAYAYTKYLGYMKLNFDASGNLANYEAEPILLDGSIARDPEILQLLEKYRPGIDNLQHTVIGQSKVFLNGSCRYEECNLGNLITDSMVSVYASKYHGEHWTDAPIALIQGGGIRASQDIGNITLFDLTTILPFENDLMTINVTGTDLLLALEHSVERYNYQIGNGEFLQMSGLHVTYNLTNDNGSRVISARALCSECTVPKFEDVVPNKVYTIIIPSFLNEGGDGYSMFAKTERNLLQVSDADAAQQYVEKLKVVYPAVEWRILITGNATRDSGAGHVKVSIVTVVITLLLTGLFQQNQR